VTISLTNTSGRCQVFVLAHEVYCKALGNCACDLGQGRAARRISRSLTLAAGLTAPELDDAVLAVPEVVRAVRRGELAVKRHVAEPPRPAAARAPTIPTPTSLPEVSRPPDVTRAKKKRGAA
jgi:hypothetical protein